MLDHRLLDKSVREQCKPDLNIFEVNPSQAIIIPFLFPLKRQEKPP